MKTQSPNHLDNFIRAGHTAEMWLDTVAEHLGTKDRHYAYRVLRAWLHTVRDRLSAQSAAHFSAQLPLLLRGLYFDGWLPSRVPVKYDAAHFLLAVTNEAEISPAEARRAIPAVAEALAARCAPGQLEHLLAPLPHGIRVLLRPEEGAR